ncbi:MAG: hypothetical protein RH859_02565 [Longimicrobiales bacterium]
MRVAVFGGSGMVGGGVLRECLRDARVSGVVSVGRRTSGLDDPKLDELIVEDLFELTPYHERFRGLDACLYCLGVSSAGLSEADYRRVTYDLTCAVLEVVSAASPGVTVCFVSGQGSDGTGTSRTMWARVKGEAENEVLARYGPAYVFRPGLIQPLEGVRSRTLLYQVPLVLMGPLFPLLRRLFPRNVTSTVLVARAMLNAAADGYAKSVLETEDINRLGGRGGAGAEA